MDAQAAVADDWTVAILDRTLSTSARSSSRRMPSLDSMALRTESPINSSKDGSIPARPGIGRGTGNPGGGLGLAH